MARLGGLQRPVVVAVVAMRVMQVPAHQVIRVVAVGNRLVPTARAVLMPRVVVAARMVARTPIRVLRAHRDRVLVAVIVMNMMHVPVVQVVRVAVVLDCSVAAIRPVLVVMSRMQVAAHIS
jgi:hypothetical protein